MTNPEFGAPDIFEEALPRLYEILFEEELIRQVALDEQPGVGEVLVDLEAMRVVVNQDKAEAIRQELKSILALYPGSTYPDLPPLAAGPSYIHVGAALGSQRSAFGLFAVGEALGFWSIITPKRLLGENIDPEEAERLMASGFIMIDGYRPE